MNKLDILQNLGLSDKEAKTYLAILELGSATIKPIAIQAGIKRTAIYYFIDHLVELGLISQKEINGRLHYTANPPSRLEELEEERLRAVKAAMPDFLSIFNLNPAKPRISYFEGPEQVKNIIREEPRCHKEIKYIWPSAEIVPMIGGVSFLSQIDRERIDKGVNIKVIRFRDKDIQFDTSSSGLTYLRELRWGPENINLTMGMGIYDTGKVSFFSSQKESFGILIESKELFELMSNYHELLWAISSPAKVGEG